MSPKDRDVFAGPTGFLRDGAAPKLPSMTDDRQAEVWGNKDGRAWRIGGEAEVAWIRENTEVSLAITSAVPPVFEVYATLELPGSRDHLSASPFEDTDRHNAGVLAVLSEHSAGQPWWLGYLDTGGADIVFHDVRKVRPGPTSDGLGTCWSRLARSKRASGATGALEESPAGPDLSGRSLVARLDLVGRRLDMHRRISKARGRFSDPS